MGKVNRSEKVLESIATVFGVSSNAERMKMENKNKILNQDKSNIFNYPKISSLMKI